MGGELGWVPKESWVQEFEGRRFPVECLLSLLATRLV